MIKLDSPADFPKLEVVHPLVKKYIIKFINGLLAEYNISDLSEIGSVIIITAESKLSDFQSMGFPQPLEKMQNELAEILILKNGTDEIRLLHAVYILSDSWGIDIYIPENQNCAFCAKFFYKEFTGERVIELEEC